jgi:hypothetical protein
MSYPKRVGGVRFIEVSGRPEPVLPALLLRNLDQIIASLPPAQRAKVLARGRELIAEELNGRVAQPGSALGS